MKKLLKKPYAIPLLVGVIIILCFFALKAAWRADQKPSPSPATSGKSGTQAYTAALKKYAGTRLQFDSACQVYPSYMTVKNGTPLMLDNRTAAKITVALGSKKYSVPAYSYLVVTARGSTLPQNLMIDCNAAQNVGQVLIQR